MVSFTLTGDWDIVNIYKTPPSQQATREQTFGATWRIVYGPRVNYAVHLSELRRDLAQYRNKGVYTFQLSWGFTWRTGVAGFTAKDIRPGASCEKYGIRKTFDIVAGYKISGQKIFAFMNIGDLFREPKNPGLCVYPQGFADDGTWKWKPKLPFDRPKDTGWVGIRSTKVFFPIDVPLLVREGVIDIPVSYSFKREKKDADPDILNTWNGEVTIRL